MHNPHGQDADAEKKAPKVVKDVDLSYLTLTALTLEEMKRKERRRMAEEKYSKRMEQNGDISLFCVFIVAL